MQIESSRKYDSTVAMIQKMALGLVLQNVLKFEDRYKCTLIRTMLCSFGQ